MRTFVALWISLIAAIAIQIAGYNLWDWGGGNWVGFNPLGNAAFALTFALLVWRSSRIRILSLQVLAGMVGFALSCVAEILTAVIVIPHSPALGMLMTSPVGAIGAYPAGADVPLPEGAIAWAATLCAPIVVGLLAGLLLRKLAPRQPIEVGEPIKPRAIFDAEADPCRSSSPN